MPRRRPITSAISVNANALLVDRVEGAALGATLEPEKEDA